jgi:hypothetical protein
VIVQRRELLERVQVRLDHRVTFHHLELAVEALEEPRSSARVELT